MRRLLQDHAVAAVAGLLVAALFVLLLGQILLRAAGRPLVWAEEFSTFGFVWLVFAGAAAAYQRREHLEVDLFHDWAATRLGPRAMTAWSGLVLVLQLVFLGVFGVGLGLMTRQSWALFAGSLPGFRFGWIYLGVGLAVLLAIVLLAARLWALLRRPPAAAGPAS